MKRMLLLPGLLSAALFFAACTTAGDATEGGDAGVVGDGSPSATAASTAAAGDGGGGAPASASATAAAGTTPAASPGALSGDGQSVPVSPALVRYVANTSGSGVSLRDGCHGADRVEGAWAEGTKVDIVRTGVGECEGWSVAFVAGQTSWVSDDYLASNLPVVARTPVPAAPTAISPPPSIVTPSPTTTATPTPAAVADGQFVVEDVQIVYPSSTPEVRVTVRNISDSVIIGWQVTICAFDRFDVPVQKYGYQSNCTTGLSSFGLGPGNVYVASWMLYGQTGASWATAAPLGSQLPSGEQWTP